MRIGWAILGQLLPGAGEACPCLLALTVTLLSRELSSYELSLLYLANTELILCDYTWL